MEVAGSSWKKWTFELINFKFFKKKNLLTNKRKEKKKGKTKKKKKNQAVILKDSQIIENIL